MTTDNSTPMIKLTAKSVRMALKRHESLEDLAQKNNISVEDLKKFIEKSYHADANKILKDFERNSKKSKVSKKKEELVSNNSFQILASSIISNESPIEVEAIKFESEGDVTTVENTEMTCIDVPAIEILETSCVDIPPVDLCALRKSEATLSKEIIEMENAHKTLVSKRHLVTDALVKVKKTLEELQRLVNKNSEIVRNQTVIYNDLSNQMQDITKNLDVKRNEISEIRAQIKNAEKAYIYIYSSTMEIEYYNTIPEISEDDITQKTSSFIFQSFTENLRVKEARLISKLILITDYFNSLNIPYDISFDNEEVQQCYNSILMNL